MGFTDSVTGCRGVAIMKWPVSSTVRGRTGRWGLAARRQWIAADHGGAFSRDDRCRLDAAIHAHGCDQGKKTRILSNASDGPVRGPAIHGLFVLPYPRDRFDVETPSLCAPSELPPADMPSDTF